MKKVLLFSIASVCAFFVFQSFQIKKIDVEYVTVKSGSLEYLVDMNDLVQDANGDFTEKPVQAYTEDGLGKMVSAGHLEICPGTGNPCSFIVVNGNGDVFAFSGKKGTGHADIEWVP